MTDWRVLHPFVWRGAVLMAWRYGLRGGVGYLRTFRWTR